MKGNGLRVIVQVRPARFVSRIVLLVVCGLMLTMPGVLRAQTKVVTKTTASQKKKQPVKSTPAKPLDELARLREEFIKLTGEYKASLEKLQASYEKSVGSRRRAGKIKITICGRIDCQKGC
jgi:hypothetical protein